MRLDNLSKLAVGRLVGLQHSSVIIYLVVIVFGQIRRQFLRECVIILKCENSFIVRFSKMHGHRAYALSRNKKLNRKPFCG